MIRQKSIAFFLLVLSVAAVGRAQDPSVLTIDRIFANGEFEAEGFYGFRWLKSGSAYTRVEPNDKGGTDLVAYDVEKNTRTILLPSAKLVPEGASAPLRIEGYQWSDDNRRMLIYTSSRRVWRENTRGDYWTLDLETGRLRKLGGADAKPSTLMFAKFSPDGTRVGYVRENDVYVESVADGRITRLTSDGTKTLSNGTSDWVNEEEFFLRDCWRWSPDGKSIAYWQFDASGIRDFVLVNDTEDLYPKLTYIPYPKAGTTNAAVRVGVVSADGGATKWIKTPGDPRQNYIAMMDWTDNSNELVLQHLNRLQNELQLMVADARTGDVRTILKETDAAWVDVSMTEMEWLDGGRSFLWLSERDGWRRAYKVSRDGATATKLTGDFDVEEIESVDEKGGFIYFIASPENAAQRYLYRAPLAAGGGGKAEKLTPEADKGWNGYNISANSRFAVHTYSAFGRAPRSEIVDLSGARKPQVMVDNAELQRNVDRVAKGPSEFFKVDIGGGTTLDGWMIKPPNFDAKKKYPIIFYVYGEPAGQTVVDRWGDSDYMWFLMLAQKGYVVASVDNRGTPAPRGRDWRKSVYRKIGVLTSADQAAAARALLAKNAFLDPARVGIWGWSGGGSSTLNAMFRYPEIYKMGMSVAPVPNMRFYDTIYQERYMGLPQDNAADYEQGSPVTFAKNLRGRLLVVHGTGDDNVHYQGTETLINELIKQNKQFTMFAYPNRTHGIYEGENTTRHLYSMLTDFLTANL